MNPYRSSTSTTVLETLLDGQQPLKVFKKCSDSQGAGVGNDYIALFGGADTTAEDVRVNESGGFTLHFDTSSDGNATKKESSNDHFFDF